MTVSNRPLTIALEEHYCDADLVALFAPNEQKRPPHIEQRLFDLGQLRLREMDEAGIDIQVLSHSGPATQKLDPETAVRMAIQTNDRLAASIALHPARFAGFAVLPTPSPEAAADELERSVTQLGFKGALVNGLTNGKFLDEKQFWPIFARAQALDVPVYLHPAFPDPAVSAVYYNGYAREFPELNGPVWGFTAETANQAIRMVLSGVFNEYPRLKIILGHLGEGLPFLLWRINDLLHRPMDGGLTFAETFRKHFYLTTSGNFSDSALTCSIAEMGIDRIMFSVDWPFASNKAGTGWIGNTGLSAQDKAGILGATAQKLLRL
ncbi:MAG: amidohydrolase family protein [Tardiphaga sp.]